MAITTRRPDERLVAHSDHGTQLRLKGSSQH
jgi:hypothetical protein